MYHKEDDKINEVFYTPIDLKKLADLYNADKSAREEREGKKQLNNIMVVLHNAASKGLRSCKINTLSNWTKEKLIASGFKISDNSDEYSNEYIISGW